MKLERLALCLVLACAASRPAQEREDTEAPPPAGADAGADAGAEPCPPYQPDENGVVQLRRGCPLTIDYQIQ